MSPLTGTRRTGSALKRAARQLYEALLFKLGQQLIQLRAQLQRSIDGQDQAAAQNDVRLPLAGYELGAEHQADLASLKAKAVYTVGVDHGGREAAGFLFLGHDGTLRRVELSTEAQRAQQAADFRRLAERIDWTPPPWSPHV